MYANVMMFTVESTYADESHDATQLCNFLAKGYVIISAIPTKDHVQYIIGIERG